MTDSMIPARLSSILISENSTEQLIWLEEIEGQRRFPIVIGLFEAAAIDRNIKEIRTPRPLTHDLLVQTIHDLGARLDRVEVHDLRGGTFYSRIIVDREGEEIEIDSRPSDAIAVAVATETPIFVGRGVLEEASARG